MASNNSFTPPFQIQRYQQLVNNLTSIRHALERTDLSAEHRSQLQNEERELQQEFQLFQTFLSNNFSPRLTMAQQQAIAQQIATLSQQKNVTTGPAGIPGSAAGSSAGVIDPTVFAAQQLAQQQRQQQQQLAAAAAAAAAAGAAGGVPQRQQSPHTPKQPMTQQTPQPPPIMTAPPSQTSRLSASKQSTPVATPTKGMFTFPTMSGPPISANMGTKQSTDEASSKVLGKRHIQELAGQIDPAERLEPEVEDLLLEIADEFIESVTKFACRLAKHRKSDVLEVKDLQLHLERNWNVRIPGFASEEIRSLRKPTVHSSHQARIQAVNAARIQSNPKKDT